MNGSSEPILVETGATVTVTGKPYKGYRMGGYTILSGSVQKKDNFQFVMGNEDVTVSISFQWSPNYYYDPTGRPDGTGPWAGGG